MIRTTNSDDSGTPRVPQRSYPDVSAMTIVHEKHFGRIVAAVIILLFLAYIVHAFYVGQIEWQYVRKYLTVRSILEGVVNTIVMAVLAMLMGTILGIVIAVMRNSENAVVKWVSWFYVWLFRGMPVVLQLMIWYNLALVFPRVSIPGVWSGQMVDIMTPFLAALLGLGLNQGAYTSEIIRSGLISVDHGQYEAAQTIGMTRLYALRRIILPQAMRVVIPPLGNEFITMVKTTSLASVIQYTELMFNAETIYYSNARVVELLFVAAIWYLVLVSILTMLQVPLERHFSRGIVRK